MSDGTPTTDNSVFEGLFGKLLKPEGAFAEDLRAIGYDVDKPKPRYHTQVLQQALSVAARHVYPELPIGEALHKLGQRFSERYLTTILGRITRTLVLALGVEKFIMQMPKIVALTSTGLGAKVERLGVGEYLISFTGEHQSPDFIAGAIEGGATDLSIFKLKAEVVRREPTEFDLKLTGLRK